MAVSSDILNKWIEPALYAVKDGSRKVVQEILTDVRKDLRDLRKRVEVNVTGLDSLSFEFGVATSLVEILATTEQRSSFDDAVKELNKFSDGVELLHEIALICRSARSTVKQKEFAQQLGMDGGNFNRRIKRLVDIGLVSSQKVTNGLTYSLTPLGEDVLDELKVGWKALHPNNDLPFENEADATTAAESLLTARVHQMIGETNRIGALLRDAPVPNVVDILGSVPRQMMLLTSGHKVTRTPASSNITNVPRQISHQLLAELGS